MTEQTQKDRLLEVLTELGGSAGNGKLREALKWDDETYAAVRDALLAEGAITPGRGRGGSVAIADAAATKAEQPKRRAERAKPAKGNDAHLGFEAHRFRQLRLLTKQTAINAYSGARRIGLPLILLCGTLVLFLSAVPAYADDARNPFATIRLPKGVTLEVPRNWKALSHDQRITLNASVEATIDLSGIGSASSSTLPFAANIFANGASIALMNVRYYDDIEITQQDVRTLPDYFAQDFDAEMKNALDEVGRAQGWAIAKWNGTKVGDIFGTAVILTGYVRTPIGDNSSNSQIRLARVLDGDQSFTLTVSHDIDQEMLLRPITDKILMSLRTRWSRQD